MSSDPRPSSPIRALALALAALALALPIAACGGSGEEERESPAGDAIDLVIGSSVPLSGPLSEFGPGARKAARLAIGRLKRAIEDSGVDGSVSLVTEDSETDPAIAESSIRQMAERDSAGCVVGPWSSAEVIGVARSVSIPDRVPLISPAATLDEITSLEDDGLVNRTVPPDSLQGPVLAGAIAEDLDGAKGSTVSIAARGDRYGEPLANSFERAWRAAGGELGARAIYDPETEDLAGVAKRLSRDRADALVVIDFPPGFERLAAALERTGAYDPDSTWGTGLLASTELAADAERGLVEGVRGTAPGVPDDEAPTKEFARLLEDAEPRGLEPNGFEARAFDAVVLCYLAALAAGSTEGESIAAALPRVSAPEGRVFTWERLAEAMKALEAGREIDYEGASGPIDLDRAGNPTAGTYDVYRFAKGRLVLDGERPLVGSGDKR